MIEIGKLNTLTVLRETSVGMFLGDETGNDILLPNKYVPRSLQPDDSITVFVYTDSEDRPIATTLTPKAMRHEFAYLEVVASTAVGAFLDLGLEKDLLVPYKEQGRLMEVGYSYVVFLYLDDETNRLVASSKLNKFLDPDVSDLREGDEVDLLAYDITDLGVNVILNNRYRGLVYASDIFKRIYIGDRMTGYIKLIRDDDRIDVTLQKPGYEGIEPNARRILEVLKAKGGFLPLSDASQPEAIYKALEMSKKTFKKAVGALYRERQIRIEDDGIHLV
ncbi:MAG: GntR family transcriptional regulator [Bacteroidetes bacterium]|nr:GntR family transcriptional regulator [Fibrella sp.]